MSRFVTSTGYGHSGSSSVTDILREFDCIDCRGSNEEFTFLHETDGLGSLEDAVREGHRLKVDMAMERFLELSCALSKQKEYQKVFGGKFFPIAQRFIDSLSDISWRGYYKTSPVSRPIKPPDKRQQPRCPNAAVARQAGVCKAHSKVL